MANCEEFTIIIQNRTGVEIRASKFEYQDLNRSKVENIFGLDGSDTIDDGDEKSYKRNLQGISGELTKFTVTYQHRIGNNWSGNHVGTTSLFKCHDKESKTIVLTD